jgi:Tfp pilus assembly protein PilV
VLKGSQRGQALLETLLTVAAVLVAVGVATIAVRVLATNRHPQAARLAALEAAQNAAVELLAASAYDPDALARIAGSGWQSGTTSLTLVPASPSPGAARGFVLHYKGSGVEGDLPFTVRSVAPPPGTVIDPSAPPGN